MRTAIRSLALVVLALLANAGRPATAGTISLAWDPVADADLAGYRVYYGTSPNNYAQSVDVGNGTQTTIGGLTDCTVYYLAVKAYDTAANESTTYSNQVQGLPRPVVVSASPSTAEAGRRLMLTVAGANFQIGAAALFSKAGITVHSTTVNACGQLTMDVSIGSAVAAGTSNIEITNPDGVFGTGAAIFTVQAAVPPSVIQTTPADGANGVSVAVHPTVTFSEAMLASSITPANARLLDDAGAAVPQAAGSPSLSADGTVVTVTPAANLTQGKFYKIQVVGGAGGVLDLANRGMASTMTQGTGFGTVADTTAPTISAVAASGLSGTRATITWTTNEVSDSQVFFRTLGDVAYQQTSLDATRVTSHSTGLAGLEPLTTYEYFVVSADAAGNAATSVPTRTFVTAANSFSYLRFEAESGALLAPIRGVNGTAGSYGGAYIDTPAGTATGASTAPSGTATFGVNVPSSGTWYLWVRLYGSDAGSKAWFESINGAARQQIAPSLTGQWQWVAGRAYTLPAGLATVELSGRNAQARADRVLLTNDATFVPTEQPVGDQTPPSGVTGFTAAGTSSQVTLAWTNPASPDFDRTIIRFRTDGKFPVSPVDGFPVASKPGAPGAADSFIHTGLASGTTYSYSAFSVDTSGNLAPPAKASAVATDTTAPAAVENVRRGDARTP